jgi:arylsulfatase A-like enzyme
MFYTDLWIGKLLDHLRKQPYWNETVVIVSADHGEAFGEHKMHRHAFELWNVLTHVPWFIRVPGAEPAWRPHTTGGREHGPCHP